MALGRTKKMMAKRLKPKQQMPHDFQLLMMTATPHHTQHNPHSDNDDRRGQRQQRRSRLGLLPLLRSLAQTSTCVCECMCVWAEERGEICWQRQRTERSG